MTPLSVYVGKLMHQRHDDKAYRFSHPYTVLCLDADHWQSQCQQASIQVNRWGVFGCYQQDYGLRCNTMTWREQIEQLLNEQGFSSPIHRLLLAATPRFLGRGFNPLCMWFAYNEQDELIALIAEVSNTFGEFHHYIHHADGQALVTPVRTEAKKAFHVSPFLNMPLFYHFRITPPAQTYQIVIEEMDAFNQPVLTAVQAGECVSTDDSLFRIIWRSGLTSFGVLFHIHWQAFRLWLRGATFYSTKHALGHRPKQHTRMQSCRTSAKP